MDKTRINDNGEIMPKCGFAVRKTYEGQKDFDTDYVSYEIKKVVKKIGDGEDDYVLEDKVIIHKQKIADVIQADACNAGIDAYLEPFVKTGQPLPDVKVTDDINDFSNMPEDLAGALDLVRKQSSMFNLLDPKLKGDAKTPEEFLANMTQDKFNAYIESVTKKPVKKEEEVINNE